MELNLSTMILEIINFLVLVWILKRFLYHPVLNIIDKRKHDIEEKLELAQSSTQKAESLQQQYDQRLHSWNEERQGMREQLNNELALEREKRIRELDSELADMRDKARQIEKLQLEESRRALEFKALAQANHFSTKLLNKLACPALQDKLLELLLHDLTQLTETQLAQYKHHWLNQEINAIKVLSAYPLSDQQKSQVQQALKQLTQLDLPFEYRQQTSLVAGLQINIGSWVIHANLENELRAFTELADVTELTDAIAE